ncbi:MAG: (2Fe-2S)-binding protein [Gammaproteobacteria bacterium]|nr:(2Fe-2S)-binding protein [Gammaproteobacteria bacterium]
MYVCICNEVTESDIRRSVDAGVHDMVGLSLELGVATCCGLCSDTALAVLDDAVSEALARSRRAA